MFAVAIRAFRGLDGKNNTDIICINITSGFIEGSDMRKPVNIIFSASAVMAAILGFTGQAMAQNWEKVYDGVEYCYFENELHVVRIDTDLIGVSIFPRVSAKGEQMTTKAWAEKHELEVAINANFYNINSNQLPLGMAIFEGTNWGESNTTDFAQFGFTKDNRLKYYTADHTDQPDWLYNAVAGEPEIIRNGARIEDINSTHACKVLGHCKSSRSRSGICADKGNKHIIISTTKGDKTNGGITVNQFADLMVKLGCDYGVNLDGGGSASIYLKGQKYGTNGSRKVPVSLGFDVVAKPSYVCKAAEIDNPGTVFFDMEADHWAIQAVQALREHAVTEGCGGESGRPLYCPNCGMRRFEAAQFIAKALGLADAAPASPSFTDVPAGSDGFGAIEALAEKNIIAKGESFRPNDIMTKQEAAVLLARAFVENMDIFAGAPTPTFTDIPSSHEAYAAIEALARNCMISSDDGMFHPEKVLDRAAFGDLLARAAGYITGACAFEKKCQTLDEKTCQNEQPATCVAYEWVSTPCPDGIGCYQGACAECDNAAPKACIGNKIKACINGAWKETDCESAGMICEDAACVLPPVEPECDSSYQEQCDEQGRLLSCKNGTIIAKACSDNYVCSEGECIEKAGSGNDEGELDDGKSGKPGNNDDDDDSDDDKPAKPGKTGNSSDDDDDPDSDDETVVSSKESSCASHPGSSQHFPWVLAFAAAGMAFLRRRKLSNH